MKETSVIFAGLCVCCFLVFKNSLLLNSLASLLSQDTDIDFHGHTPRPDQETFSGGSIISRGPLG